MVQSGGALQGKRAVVTGSSMGIGKAVARRFLQEGAMVVINARDRAAMAVDLAHHGIRVNTVCPGAGSRPSTGDNHVRKIEERHCRGALSDERRAGAFNPAAPEYVASLYAFLASDLAIGMTGRLYIGSGGYIGRFGENPQELLTSMEHGSHPPSSVWEVAEALLRNPGSAGS